jgi:cell division transport system permease protein
VFGRGVDLPLGEDGSGRYVPWIVALMVYLAALAITGGLVAARMVDLWVAGIENTITVEIVPALDSDAGTDARVRSALELLRTTAGVRSATPVPPSKVADLLSPWVGSGDLPSDLPIPRLIDVRLEPGTQLDVAALATQIEALVPGAHLDDHRLWRERLATFGRSVIAAAVLVVALVGTTAAAIVVFATQASLAIHREVIKLLHLIGARESYIARQFQRHFFALALKGGLIGTAFGAVTLLALGWMARPLEGTFFPPLTLTPTACIALAALPAAAAALSMLTARLTVVRALKEMP